MRTKCIGCGFINFPQDIFCKRCKSRLEHALEYQNVWRDGKKLVMGADAILPKLCLKCSTTENVARFPLSLTYTPVSAYFTILLSITYWWDVETYGYLCTSHRNAGRKQMFLLLPNSFIFFGGASVLLSLIGLNPDLNFVLFVGGGLMFALGLFLRFADAPSLKIVKRNKRHIWIKGVDPDLLAQLEDFADAHCQHSKLEAAKLRIEKA